MKKADTLNMRVLRTPRLVLEWRGFVHGKITRSGGIDPETNMLASSFITGQSELFRSVCAACRGNSELRTKKVWDEADKLLIELSGSDNEPSPDEMELSFGEAKATDRAKDRLAKMRAARAEEYNKKMERLSEIANTIRGEYDNAISLMEATDAALMNAFSSYGHGLIMRPVYPHNLPVLNYRMSIDEFFHSHKTTWNGMITRLQEV